MVRPTDQKTTATGKSLLLIVPKRRAYTLARWALWRSSRVSQEEKAEKGKCRQEPLLWLLLEGMGKVGSAGQGLVGLNNFSGIWGVSFNPGWSGQGVEGPNRGSGVGWGCDSELVGLYMNLQHELFTLLGLEGARKLGWEVSPGRGTPFNVIKAWGGVKHQKK